MISVFRWALARPSTAVWLALGLALVAVAPGTETLIPFSAQLADTDVTDGTGVTPPPPAAQGTPAAATATSSAVTVQGKGDFTALKVTVDQTRDLINQAVKVSWTGGKPTVDASVFQFDYLQMMQCWGDAATGPERTQCEYGGSSSFDTRGGDYSAKRQIAAISDPSDPLEAKAKAAGQSVADQYVPFVSVTGVTVKGADTLRNNPFYDNTTTNELTYGRTRADGTGEYLFEMQTYRESSGLGCGQLLTSGANVGKPRSCWLVIVPRGESEVDGTSKAGTNGKATLRLNSSPLSTTNWANRLVVPLQFVNLGAACSITSAEKPTTGVESATEVVLRWQPSLCSNSGPVFGYSQSPNATGERTLSGAEPGLVFLNGPAPAPPPDRLYTYAPVALSGLGIGVVIDRRNSATATDAEKATEGQPMLSVNLTPRLVAKMLTQSYTWGPAGTGSAKYLEKNVENLAQDPDFLAVNPAFKDTEYHNDLDLITPLGLATSNQLLWQWINSDQDAVDFLNGLPDPWGMRVNPFYQGPADPHADVPKVDPFCIRPDPALPVRCSLDEHPYSQDMHEATRSASRGDTLSRITYDPTAIPPSWKKGALQFLGQRRVMSLSDTATAARYGLVVANLRNAAGQFVAPTSASLLAAAASMRPSGTAGVLAADPATSNAAAYPLPLITYAVTAPNILNAADAKSYAAFVRYAVGQGQTPGVAPGTLPAGYVALPTSLRTVALAAATAIEARKGPAVTPTPKPSSGSKSSSTGSGSAAGNSPNSGTGSGGALPTPTALGSLPSASAEPAPVSSQSLPFPSSSPAPAIAFSPAGVTPADPAGRGRYALAMALLLGVTASLLGPSLPRLARRLRQ